MKPECFYFASASAYVFASREQPIFSTKAHVFHIDPKTKRSWIPASSQAVSVSFFYDSSRNLYRIISVEGTKAVINSTITPNMTFTKTSQKFGQWSDIRANTVYGLGFGSEPDLNKFIEKFQEVKEATRLAAQKAGNNGVAAVRPPEGGEAGGGDPTALHSGGSPKHQQAAAKASLPQTTAEAQLRYENDRLKLALAQSSANAKKWEVELQTLKNNNGRLTCALQESTANVEEWKRQLQALKEENATIRGRMLDLEAGSAPDAQELRRELATLRSRAELLDREHKQKDKELEALKRKLEDQTPGKADERLKALLSENEALKSAAQRLQEQLCVAQGRQAAWEQLAQRIAHRLHDLRDLQHELAALLSAS
ncbi:homer protein homolog 2 isoform X1 [Dermacentor albipictus]|uniref:homer protein homolog 2 isoform X1 n=1 Tax=Dermacentor albipictus TaxID=60249 RepID=UPI0031FC01C5